MDVYVYRDTGTRPDEDAADSPAQHPAEHDAAYWYDLLTEDTTPKPEKTRGPFEPLVSSGGLANDAAHQQPATPEETGEAATPQSAGVASPLPRAW